MRPPWLMSRRAMAEAWQSDRARLSLSVMRTRAAERRVERLNEQILELRQQIEAARERLAALSLRE